MAAIRTAKAKGWAVTSEVTPHHLGLSVVAGDLTLKHIVNPPLRSEQDRQAVIAALLDGTADCISTDHTPHTIQDKANGAPGFSGLETAKNFLAEGLAPQMVARCTNLPLETVQELMKSEEGAGILQKH